MQARLGFIGISILMLHQSAVAQITYSFSDYFDQFYNNYYLLNTANTDSSYKIAAKISNKTQTGLFEGVSKLYLDLDLKIPNKKEAAHFVGIQILNNKEGEFINKSRLLGRYSFRIKISDKSSLSTGISLGFINYTFNTSQSGTGGSSWVPDGNIGLWYLRKKIAIGISMQQLFNQRIRPVNQTFTLDSYYNLTIRHTASISRSINLNTHLFSKWQKNQPLYFVLASLFEVQEKFDVGVSYSYLQGLSYVVGLKALPIGKSRFSFHFSYFTGINNINVNDNAFELLLSYQR